MIVQAAAPARSFKVRINGYATPVSSLAHAAAMLVQERNAAVRNSREPRPVDVRAMTTATRERALAEHEQVELIRLATAIVGASC